MGRKAELKQDLEVIDLSAPAPPAPPTPPTPRPAGRPHQVPRPPETDVNFYRWVFTPLEAGLDRLEGWTGTPGALGRSRVLRERPAPSGRRLTVLLHRGHGRAPVRMELDVSRSAAPFGTQLTLRPDHEIKPGRRYFREGNALLDYVEDLLEAGPTGVA